LIVKSPAAFIKSPASIDSISDRLASSRREVVVNSPPPARGSQKVGWFRPWRAAEPLPEKQASQIEGGFGWAEFDGRLAGARSSASGSMARSGARWPGDSGNLNGR
jgi:hypothetical protein